MSLACSAVPKVLVVDDDPTTCRTIEAILRRSGLRTVAAGDVAGALEAIGRERPDMLLLDVSLPDGSGIDLCRRLQSDAAAARTPVIFISAHEDVTTKVQGFEAGGVDYLTKPVAGAEVLARVRTHLRLKQASERLVELQAERVERLAAAQQSMMPRPEDVPGARFAAWVRQVLSAGGDFYDVIPVGEGLVDYLVADASGHDLASTLWVAALKALAVEYASPLNLPGEVVRAINGALCRFMPPGAFFTLVYARVDHRSGRLSLASAGHPPAVILPAGRAKPEILTLEGDVAGAFPDAAFGLAERELGPGDRLLLFSDGLIEFRGATREDGIGRLATICAERRGQPLGAMVPAVAEELLAGRQVEDDTILMGVER